MTSSKAIIVLSAAFLLSACSPTPASKLIGEWECDSHTVLSFKDDGAFKIVSTAAQQPTILEGRYSVKEFEITVDGPVMEPLSHKTSISLVSRTDLALTSGGSDLHTCRRVNAANRN